MITFDGERSKARKVFAQKQLRVIKELGLPSKAVKWDGFTFRVWQQDDLSGGRVTAPMGVVVVRINSESTPANLFVADSWEGSFTSAQSLYVISRDAANSLAVFDKPEEVSDVYVPVPWRTRETLSPCGYEPGGAATHLDHNPTASIIPLGEGFFITATGMPFIDLNDNGIPDSNKVVVDSSLLFYTEKGSRLVRRSGVTQNVTDTGVYPMHTVFNLDSIGLRQVKTHITGFDFSGSVRVACPVFQVTHEGASVSYRTCAQIWDGMPEELEAIISSPGPGDAARATPTGFYAFTHNGSDVLLAGTKLYGMFDTTVSEVENWLSANSAEEWRLFYSIYDGENHIVDSSQFLPLLATRTGYDMSSTTRARRAFQALFGWPNNDFYNAYDSAMFHGHDGNVYSWTRLYGSFKFTTAGIFDGAVSVPVDVTTEGVRPEITHAGDGVYVCVCNHVGNGIVGVYVGSPFGTWTRLDDPGSEFTLLHVRPARAIATDTGYDAVLIGVVEKAAFEETPAEHYTCLYKDGWKVLAQIPRSKDDAGTDIEYDGYEQYSIAFFGDGPVPNMLREYPSRPHALPQMPVGPYEYYAIP